MVKTKLLLLVLCLAVYVVMCRSWVEDVAEEDTNAKDEDVKQFAAEIFQSLGLEKDDATQNMRYKAEEETNAIDDVAKQFAAEISQSLGLENDDCTQNMKYKAEDATSRATDTMKSAASGASQYASQKATDTKEAISGAMSYGREKTSESYNRIGRDENIRMPTEKVTETYEDAKQKLNTASGKASNMAQNVKDNMGDGMGYGREGAANVYDQGNQKLNMASDMASEKFHDAKGRASNVHDGAKEKIKVSSQKMYGEAMNGMNVVGDKGNDAKDKMGCGGDKVDETFDQAKHRVGEAYMSARDSTSEEAKAKYEAAKEKASEATGNLGAKMRNTPEP